MPNGAIGMGRFRIKRSSSASVVTIDLPIITKISDSMSVTLTEYSTMVYGYKENFCMDIGNSERLSVSVTRVNPMPYNDASEDPNDWSNGVWCAWVKNQLDFWQNFGRDPDNNERTGGFKFEFYSLDTTLCPDFEYNVFLAGNIQKKYGVGKVTLEFPLQISRMNGASGGSSGNQVTLTLDPDNSEIGDVQTVTVQRGILREAPEMPTSWDYAYQMGLMFDGWSTVRGASTPQYTVGDGTRYAWTENTTLYAVWSYPRYIRVWDTRGSEESITIPEGVSTAVIIAVGAGGCGGACYGEAAGIMPGGAGGAGQFVSTNISVSPNQVFTCSLGRGGYLTRTTSGDVDKHSGSATVVYRDGVAVVTAQPGDNGADSQYDGTSSWTIGAGGSRYFAGGQSVQSLSENASDGSTEERNGEPVGLVGLGGSPWTREVGIGSYMVYGAGGGGASALNHVFMVNSTRYPASGTYRSIGGCGREYVDSSREDMNGTYGGGGSGGPRFGTNYITMGGDGGDGFAVILLS